MKKFIAIIALVVTFAVTLCSYRLPGRAMFQGDHITINMEPDGSCLLRSRQMGDLRGSYDVQEGRSVEPGCSNVTVTFNFGGQVVYGTIMWPTSEGICLYFDGTIMKGYYGF